MKPLTVVINQSLSEGLFSDKHSNYRKLSHYIKRRPSKYGSLSTDLCLLPSISKLYEEIVFIELTEYPKTNKISIQGRYRFRENHTTELAATELMDIVISALENSFRSHMEMSKAFDILAHNIKNHVTME